MAGVAATVGGWRVAFVILIVPIVIVSIVALRLREPRRGGTDDPEAADRDRTGATGALP